MHDNVLDKHYLRDSSMYEVFPCYMKRVDCKVVCLTCGGKRLSNPLCLKSWAEANNVDTAIKHFI